MQEKTKTQADRKLIKSLFKIDPIDWARYPDGSLVYIAPSGKKFKISLRMIDTLNQEVSDSKIAAKKATAKKSAAKKSESVDLNAEVDAANSFKKDAPGAAAE